MSTTANGKADNRQHNPAGLRVLMTGAGAPGAAGILHCLAQEKSWTVLAADANPHSVGRYLAGTFYQLPQATDPAFTDRLLEICNAEKINVLLPLVTRELGFLAAARDAFAAIGTLIPVSSPQSLEIANNKSSLYQFLEWRGIEVPAYHIVETPEQFEQALSALGYPDKEVCFKPSVSNGSRGFRRVTDKENEADLLFNHKPAQTSIRKADILRILASGPFPQLLVSEYLPGPEYSADCLCNQGEAILIVPRLRKRMINGISVEGIFEANTAIIAYCERIIRALKLHGNIGIQVKQHENGSFLLLEINPRVQGTISAALGAGVNLPVLAIKQEAGMPVSPEEMKVEWGVGFHRYWSEVFYH